MSMSQTAWPDLGFFENIQIIVNIQFEGSFILKNYVTAV